MLIVRNEDKPKVIGFVGMTLGDAGINIADMDVGQSPEGDAALMNISTNVPVPDNVQDEIAQSDLVRWVRSVSI